MAGDDGEPNHPPADPSIGWKERIEGEYRKIKEHAETYPYVWGSYILVYGGLTAYLAIRWRKLRRTEDRVRILQGRLGKLVEADEVAASASGQTGQPPSAHSAPSSTLTPPRQTAEKSKGN